MHLNNSDWKYPFKLIADDLYFIFDILKLPIFLSEIIGLYLQLAFNVFSTIGFKRNILNILCLYLYMLVVLQFSNGNF
jgi:hypothetical protein